MFSLFTTTSDAALQAVFHDAGWQAYRSATHPNALSAWESALYRELATAAVLPDPAQQLQAQRGFEAGWQLAQQLDQLTRQIRQDALDIARMEPDSQDRCQRIAQIAASLIMPAARRPTPVHKTAHTAKFHRHDRTLQAAI